MTAILLISISINITVAIWGLFWAIGFFTKPKTYRMAEYGEWEVICATMHRRVWLDKKGRPTSINAMTVQSTGYPAQVFWNTYGPTGNCTGSGVVRGTEDLEEGKRHLADARKLGGW